MVKRDHLLLHCSVARDPWNRVAREVEFQWVFSRNCGSGIVKSMVKCDHLLLHCSVARDPRNGVLKEVGFQWVFSRNCGSLVMVKLISFGSS